MKSDLAYRACAAERGGVKVGAGVGAGCGPDLKFCLLPTPQQSIPEDECKNQPFGNEKIHGSNKPRRGDTGCYVGAIINIL